MAIKIPKPEDLGFGSKIIKVGERLINKDGSFNIIRKGRMGKNIYQQLIRMPFSKFVGFTVLFFIIVNAIFAIGFLILGIEHLNGVSDGSLIHDFLYAFFFSVQTFTTVGYGVLNPEGVPANLLASVAASLGLAVFAITTGLFFARFSRPRSHIEFSKKALITSYRNITSFQCRLVNTRDHSIINMSAQMSLTWIETTNGDSKRRFAKLNLEREELVLFPMNWTLVHPITEDSPLHEKTLDDLKNMHAEFLIMTMGYDESYNQNIHANSSYTYDEILTGVKYKPMYVASEDGPAKLYLDDLDAVTTIS